MPENTGATTPPAARRRIWPMMAMVAAVVSVILMAAYLYLPKLVSEQLPNEVFQRLGLTGFSGQVVAITPYRTLAGPFVLGPEERPAVRIGRVDIRYTPGGLHRNTINRVRVSDIVVNVVLGSEGADIPGMDLADLIGKKADGASSPSLAIKRVEIRSGLIILHHGDRVTQVPFDADLAPETARLSPFDLRMRLFPRDQPVNLGARVDLDKRRATVEVDASMVALDAVADLIHRVPGLDAAGTVGLRGGASVAWRPVTIADAHADLYWHSGQITLGATRWAPGSDASSSVLSAAQNGDGTWRITGGGLRLQDPVPMRVEALRATIQGDRRTPRAAGSIRVVVPPFTDSTPLRVSSNAPVHLPLTFDAALAADGRWHAALATAQAYPEFIPTPLAIGYSGTSIRTGPPRVDLTAEGDGLSGRARGEITVDAIQATIDTAVVALPSITGRGDIGFSLGRQGFAGQGEADVRLPVLSLDRPGLHGRLAGVSVSARFKRPQNGSLTADGRLRCTGGRVDHHDSDSHLAGLHIDLPWGWGAATTGGQGTFNVERILLQTRDIGTIAGRLNRGAEAYTLHAILSSPLLPTLNALVSGTVQTTNDRMGHADFSLTVPDTRLPVGYDLGRWMPAANGVTLSGTLAAQGKAAFGPSGLDGVLGVSLTGGDLTLAEKKITVSGIDAALRFPELPRIRSAPAQRFRFSRAAMGGIVVDGGDFDVQVESAKTLFVEKGRLAWCGGRVDVQSLRIMSDRQDYNLTLYCQRLGLSHLLEQLGAVNASGSGTVNGRIPIAYRDGNIRFDDGFLYSTPGEEGRIQLSGTEILTRGIPVGTPQFAQVDLAREALKDYQYEWAKLGLTSEGDNFVMRLQFDGKPAGPLPFVYNKELGRFVRVEAVSPGSHFQGIGLDVNLRLPLNRLLQYKDVMQIIH